MIDWVDRTLALAWWIAAILIGPIALVGFFIGGWLILAALWAIWGNLPVRNPFASSRQ